MCDCQNLELLEVSIKALEDSDSLTRSYTVVFKRNLFDRNLIQLKGLCNSLARFVKQTYVFILYYRRHFIANDQFCTWKDSQFITCLKVCLSRILYKVLFQFGIFKLAVTFVEVPELVLGSIAKVDVW
jgi:hypothetical protein